MVSCVSKRPGNSFSEFRSKYKLKPCPENRIANDDEKIQMTASQGLKTWVDGVEAPSYGNVPKIQPRPKNAELWVVRSQDVVYAEEYCDFGKKLQTKMIKHSNLTGAKPAYCGGELIWIDETTIVITGRSGRYGPSSSSEMEAVAKSFRESGYAVWTLGYSDETDTPFAFGDRDPEMVV